METWGNNVGLFGPMLIVDMLYTHVCVILIYLLLLFKLLVIPHYSTKTCVLPKGLYLPESS